jgi:hypothetical protein
MPLDITKLNIASSKHDRHRQNYTKHDKIAYFAGRLAGEADAGGVGAGAGGVGDGGRGSGGHGRRRGGSGVAWAAVELPVDVDRGSGAGWASGRGWTSLGEAWAVPGDGGGSSATAAVVWARRRQRGLRMLETERNETDTGAGGRLKSVSSDGHVGDRRT